MNWFYKATEKIYENKKCHIWISLVLITALSSLMMFLYSPVYLNSDSVFHLNRLIVLIDALKEGNFPIYLDYNSINGYGYFTKAFYPDLTLFPYAILGLFLDIASLYKFIIFSTTILCGTTMYIAVKRIFNSSFCAIISSLLYSFSTYKIYQSFYFSTIQEIITFIFIPIVVWGLYEIISGNYKKWYILTIGFALIIFTHMITTVLVFLFLLLFSIIYYKKFTSEPIRFKYLSISAICCLLLSSYFIFPMIEQMLSNSFYYQDKPLFTSMFFRPTLHNLFGGITNNLANMDHGDPIPKMGGFLTAFICLRIFIKEKSKLIRIADIGTIIGILIIIVNIEYFPWHIFPFNKFIFVQFPWRFFKYATFFFSIAGAYYMYQLIPGNNRKVLVVLLVSIFLSATFYFDSFDYKLMKHDKLVLDNVNEEIIKEKVTLGGGAEYLPSKMPTQNLPFERGIVIDKTNDNTQLNNFTKNQGTITVDINTPGDKLEFPLTYYKGYRATLNNTEIKLHESKNGLIEIPINTSGHLKIWYAGTVIQKISFAVTIIFLLIFCFYIFAPTNYFFKLKGRRREC